MRRGEVNYPLTLLLALLSSRQDIPPTTSFSLITELIHRDGLRTALSGRDDVSLEPILRFLIRNVTDTRFGATAAQVSLVVVGAHRFLSCPSPSPLPSCPSFPSPSRRSSLLIPDPLPYFLSPLPPHAHTLPYRSPFPSADLYYPIMGQSPLIDDLFGKLQKKVNDELRMQRDVLVGLKGMVDMVLGNAIMGQIEKGVESSAPVVVGGAVGVVA